MNKNFQKPTTNSDFMRELEGILHNGETLFKNAGKQIWNEYLTARQYLGLQVKPSTADAEHGLTSLEESIIMQARKMSRSSDHFVQQHPWRAVAAGVCIGLVIGALVADRR